MLCNYALALAIFGAMSPQQPAPSSTKPTVRQAVEKVRAYERAKAEVKNGPGNFDERLKLGFTFRLDPKNEVQIVYIENENEMVVRRVEAVWLRGFSTRGLVTDRWVSISGPLVVSDTAKFGGDTIFVVTPYEPPGKPTREEFELATPELEKERRSEDKAKAKAIDKARQEAKQKEEENAAAKAKAEAATAKTNREKAADSKLRFARQLAGDGKRDTAKQWLRDLIRDYSDTPAAVEGKKLLMELEK